MRNDNIEEIIKDAFALAETRKNPLTRLAIEGIANRLQKLVDAGLYVTPKTVLESVAGARPFDAILKNPPFDSKRTTASEGRETITVEKKDWLELPRNITLKRFTNTRRETHFIGQYSDDGNKSNPNPRRVYTIDVIPMWDDTEGRAPSTVRAFEVTAHCDGNELFRLMTMHGRAVAEYLGVKALKAWLNYCGSQRRGKQSRKLHSKRNRANRRARKAAENPVNPVNPV